MFGLADLVEVLDQTQPGRLTDVGSIGRRRREAARNRPYEPRAPIDDGVPCVAVAVASRRDQLGGCPIEHGHNLPSVMSVAARADVPADRGCPELLRISVMTRRTWGHRRQR